jgi:archaellum biogenesis protein FlaJ (TadC family)
MRNQLPQVVVPNRYQDIRSGTEGTKPSKREHFYFDSDSEERKKTIDADVWRQFLSSLLVSSVLFVVVLAALVYVFVYNDQQLLRILLYAVFGLAATYIFTDRVFGRAKKSKKGALQNYTRFIS